MTRLPELARSAAFAWSGTSTLLALLLTSAAPAYAEGTGGAQAAGAGSAAAPAGIINVTAKLVEIPSKFPLDELYDYAYVMRYEVLGGPMDKKSIFVAHYKPRLARAAIKDQMKKVVSGKVRSFHEGDVQKLQLTANLKSVWKGALVDEFAATDRKSVRYFALVTDPG
jgi:hypothetical protein